MKRILIALLLAAPTAALADDRPYGISVPAVSGGVRQKVAATVAVRAIADYHIDQVYPITLKCKPPEGVSLAKNELTKADGTIDQTEARFVLVTTSLSPGKRLIPCEFRFAVASASNLDPLAVSIEIAVEAK